MHNNLDNEYQNILRKVLKIGSEKSDRTGTGTISYFGEQLRHDMGTGFPLLTTKRIAIKTMMTELKWFLKGDTNIKYLVENGCKVWNGDAYKKYKESGGKLETEVEFIDKIKGCDKFASKWGELGPIYGKQWRNWETEVFQKDDETNRVYHATQQIDQIKNLLEQLKSNPDSRRLIVSAWNVAEVSNMTLPPCHYGFQVYTRELSFDERVELCSEKKSKLSAINESDLVYFNIPTRAISLMWNQRSCDTALGLPFNIASYGTLLTLLGIEVNMMPDQLISSIGDVHLYSNHIIGATEQIGRTHFDLPTIEFSNVDILNGEFDYDVQNYEYHPTIKYPLSN